jgi:hypothetical protein
VCSLAGTSYIDTPFPMRGLRLLMQFLESHSDCCVRGCKA